MNVLYAQTCEELDCPQDIVAKLEEKAEETAQKALLASQVHVRARRQLRLAKDRVRAMVECQDEEL
jgi:hypothetical protein